MGEPSRARTAFLPVTVDTPWVSDGEGVARRHQYNGSSFSGCTPVLCDQLLSGWPCSSSCLHDVSRYRCHGTSCFSEQEHCYREPCLFLRRQHQRCRRCSQRHLRSSLPSRYSHSIPPPEQVRQHSGTACCSP